MKKTIHAAALSLLLCVLLASCGGSGGSSEPSSPLDTGSNSDNNSATQTACPADYVLGRWFHEGDEVRTTLEYTAAGEYSRLSALTAFDEIDDPLDTPPPPFTTVTTYELGNLMTNESGLEVCEIEYGGAPQPTCTDNLVYVDGDILYLSDCSGVILFDTPYDSVEQE